MSAIGSLGCVHPTFHVLATPFYDLHNNYRRQLFFFLYLALSLSLSLTHSLSNTHLHRTIPQHNLFFSTCDSISSYVNPPLLFHVAKAIRLQHLACSQRDNNLFTRSMHAQQLEQLEEVHVRIQESRHDDWD